jgi:hypothetical protein
MCFWIIAASWPFVGSPRDGVPSVMAGSVLG